MKIFYALTVSLSFSADLSMKMSRFYSIHSLGACQGASWANLVLSQIDKIQFASADTNSFANLAVCRW